MALSIVQKEHIARLKKSAVEVWSGDVMLFCPHCKAIQDATITDGVLLPTRKFKQIGDKVYHECGSSQPCKIFRDW